MSLVEVDVERTHVEWLIHRQLADELHLGRERLLLPSLLSDGEELLAVASAGMGWFKPGILAITDGRLLHLYFRRVSRRMKVTEIAYHVIRSIELETFGSSRVIVARRCKRRQVDFQLRPVHRSRGGELADCASRAHTVFHFRAGTSPCG
jgi:hypothetical protein